MPARCTKLMEKVSTTYKLTDGVLVTVMHIIKQRDRTCRYWLERECNSTIRIKATMMMRSQWWLQKARRKMHPSTYDLLYSYSYKRLSWWWWCVCHPSFLTIRSASNGCEVSCGIFATIAHFSAPICRKPLIILKATTSLPHLIKTAWEIYFEWKVLPPFQNICLSKWVFYRSRSRETCINCNILVLLLGTIDR